MHNNQAYTFIPKITYFPYG